VNRNTKAASQAVRPSVQQKEKKIPQCKATMSLNHFVIHERKKNAHFLLRHQDSPTATGPNEKEKRRSKGDGWMGL
jgi:hypothetical protein